MLEMLVYFSECACYESYVVSINIENDDKYHTSRWLSASV